MKILCVSNTSFFLYNFARGLMKSLRDAGFQVVAVAPHDPFSAKLEEERFRVVPLHQLDRKSSSPLDDARLLGELFQIYRRERPDLVLQFTIKVNVYGSIAARLAGTNSICTVTGLGWLFTDKGLKARLGSLGYKALYKIAFSSSAHVVFLNRDDRAFFLKNRLVKNNDSSVIPGSGVNTEVFHPGLCEERNNNRALLADVPPSAASFLLIGRMLSDKGVREFVEAAAIVKKSQPDAQFFLLGPMDKENRSAIPDEVIADWQHKGLVHYLGRTDDVRPFICGSDVVVLPSYREGVPSSLLEAMAMGKPVITTDAPGCREVVENGKNGYTAPVKNAARLADCMFRFMELPRLEREAMGDYARAKVLREFDEKIVTEAYLQLVKMHYARKTASYVP